VVGANAGGIGAFINFAHCQLNVPGRGLNLSQFSCNTIFEIHTKVMDSLPVTIHSFPRVSSAIDSVSTGSGYSASVLVVGR
jgi:hypothetical protein